MCVCVCVCVALMDGCCSWDFNQQSPTHLKAVIQPGDRLVTHCVYSSQTKDKRTRFGEGTDDEMCFNFLLVYPADGIRMCMDIGKVSILCVCVCGGGG